MTEVARSTFVKLQRFRQNNCYFFNTNHKFLFDISYSNFNKKSLKQYESYDQKKLYVRNAYEVSITKIFLVFNKFKCIIVD